MSRQPLEPSGGAGDDLVVQQRRDVGARVVGDAGGPMHVVPVEHAIALRLRPRQQALEQPAKRAVVTEVHVGACYDATKVGARARELRFRNDMHSEDRHVRDAAPQRSGADLPLLRNRHSPTAVEHEVGPDAQQADHAHGAEDEHRRVVGVHVLH